MTRTYLAVAVINGAAGSWAAADTVFEALTNLRQIVRDDFSFPTETVIDIEVYDYSAADSMYVKHGVPRDGATDKCLPKLFDVDMKIPARRKARVYC
jgi:hypothetical protein